MPRHLGRPRAADVHRPLAPVQVVRADARRGVRGRVRPSSSCARATYIISVGSVGQPRDYDPRASYTIYDTDKKPFEFKRVAYDIEASAEKIFAPTSSGTSATASSSASDVRRRAALACAVSAGGDWPRAAAAPAAAGAPDARPASRTTPVPTPPGYTGWERSSVAAWEAVEQQGGIVPDIEEDRDHFPPAWLRYPSPMRSAELLADGGAQAQGPLHDGARRPTCRPATSWCASRAPARAARWRSSPGKSDDQWVILETDGATPKAGAAAPGRR